MTWRVLQPRLVRMSGTVVAGNQEGAFQALLAAPWLGLLQAHSHKRLLTKAFSATLCKKGEVPPLRDLEGSGLEQKRLEGKCFEGERGDGKVYAFLCAYDRHPQNIDALQLGAS